jgi:outer membrane protein assembly factor BamB
MMLFDGATANWFRARGHPMDMRKFAKLALLGLALLCFCLPLRVNASDSCAGGVRWLFRPTELCAEALVTDFAESAGLPPGIIAISGLAFAPNGDLYFASYAGSAIYQVPLAADGAFEAPRLFARLPQRPNGLVYDARRSAWLVSAETAIYALTEAGAPTLLASIDKAGKHVFGSISLLADGTAYAVWDRWLLRLDANGAATYSELAGPAYEIVAADGQLYFTSQDALWQLGNANPIIDFAAQSNPTGLAYYPATLTAMPALQGKLLVALAGSSHAASIAGYEIWAVDLADPAQSQRWLPASQRNASDAALIRTSFYPYRLVDLAVSSAGWVYASLAEGYIYRFRPA